MKFNKIILIATLIFLFNAFTVSAIPSSFTDQGTNVEYNNVLVSSANLTITIWNHPSDNSSTALMYNNTFASAIIDGVWNVKVNTTNLEFGKQYYKDYSIDATDIDFDGEERLSFYSPLGLINNQSFVNGTSVSGWTTNTTQTTTEQNVGIGTATPSHKFEVNGSANFSNINSEIWINGSKICTVANGLCAGTIYAAGLGLNLTGTTFSINETYLQRYNDTASQIADNSTISSFLTLLLTNDSNIAARVLANNLTQASQITTLIADNITQEARIATLFTANTTLWDRQNADNTTINTQIMTLFTANTTLWDRQNADNTTITTILTTKGNVSSQATIGYLPFMGSSTSLNNSVIFQNGINIAIGTIISTQLLDVNGSANFSGQDAQIWLNGSLVCTSANGVCATTYTAGLGLNLTGTTFNINQTYLQIYNDTATQIADNITITTILTTKGNVSSQATIGYLPFMGSSTSLNNSVIFQNGINIAIGTLISTQTLDVNGSANFSGQDAQIWLNGSLVCTSANGLCPSNTYNVTGLTEFFLASSGTVGVQSITNGTIINITSGDGILVTRSSSTLQINATYQSNASGWANTSTTITTDFGVNVTSGNLTVISGNIGAGTMSPLRALHVNNVMRLEPISSAPSLPSAGDIYFDSDLNKPCYYNSTDWVTFDANTTCS